MTPIQKISPSRPHRPIYRMHRYFARRPYSVFADLIEHYSKPGMVILDPFCGGGVTLVEGLTKGRRVIGFDSNPLAVFITKLELRAFDLQGFIKIRDSVLKEFESVCQGLFSTTCRKCKKACDADWFEYSSEVNCLSCNKPFYISKAKKVGAGQWECTRCNEPNRFSPRSDTSFELMRVLYSCKACGSEEVADATPADRAGAQSMRLRLANEEKAGLWLPDASIPDCNMQRESALHKKGITKFRQFFTDRHLLALGCLRRIILKAPPDHRDWLWLAFSSTLRYTNRMVTFNPAWRGNRPLEWAKPGYWLPSVHLEATPIEEFRRRCVAIIKGKADFQSKLEDEARERLTTGELLRNPAQAYFAECRSSTGLPLPDDSVDVIITDPPYGSYVHYADLSNFWAVWLPGSCGLGKVIDDSEEAVVARKKFPKAKTTGDYQKLLERCFNECARVLKDGQYMVMTFHNREPRAWVALLLAAAKSGFELPANGVVFQDGIASYRHTAQSRRAGSVIGDFILSFRKKRRGNKQEAHRRLAEVDTEALFVLTMREILRKDGPLTPNDLMRRLYLNIQPKMMARVTAAVAAGNDSVEKLVQDFDSIDILDSHRKSLLEVEFQYRGGKWALKN